MANRKTQKKRDREKMKKEQLKNPKINWKGGLVDGYEHGNRDQVSGGAASPPNEDTWDE